MNAHLSPVCVPNGGLVRSDHLAEGSIGFSIAHKTVVFVIPNEMKQKTFIHIGGSDGISQKPITAVLPLPPGMIWKLEMLSHAHTVGLEHPFRRGQFAIYTGGQCGVVFIPRADRAKCIDFETKQDFDMQDDYAWVIDRWKIHGFANEADEKPLVVIDNSEDATVT